jgi:hypothetical protein
MRTYASAFLCVCVRERTGGGKACSSERECEKVREGEREMRGRVQRPSKYTFCIVFSVSFLSLSFSCSLSLSRFLSLSCVCSRSTNSLLLFSLKRTSVEVGSLSNRRPDTFSKNRSTLVRRRRGSDGFWVKASVPLCSSRAGEKNPSWGLCYKTFYGRNLRFYGIS